jgi:uncharacterized membrane protein YdbT with pleckstrin-like domain
MTPSDLPDYAPEPDASEESALWEGGPSHVIFLASYLSAGVTAVLILAVSMILFFQGNPIGLPLMGTLVLPLLYMGYKWLLLRSRRYEVTTQRIFFRTGILTRHTDELELYRIKDMSVVEPFFLRLFKKGNIILTTSDKTTPLAVLEAIPYPRTLNDVIRAHVEARRDAKRVREVDYQ